MSPGGMLVRVRKFWWKPPVWSKIAVTRLQRFGTGFTSILRFTTVSRRDSSVRTVHGGQSRQAGGVTGFCSLMSAAFRR